MRSDQVKGLRQGGMLVGAHTVSHPILARLPAPEARTKSPKAANRFKAILGERVSLFAYPNGKARAGLHRRHRGPRPRPRLRCRRQHRLGRRLTRHDRIQLPRFTPWDMQRTRFGLRMMHNLWTT
ncbi:MAG: polysaccharide deacetylase family protein [Ideonella sp.]|nr:polysaccharide deacetylase family protein [Ideonella sp.]